MRALSLVGVGLVVVAVDLEVGAFDVVSDPVGWALVAVGLSRVRTTHPAFGVAHLASLVAVVVSAAQVVLTLTSPVAGQVAEVAHTLVDLVVVVAVCTALAHVLPDRDPRSARAARAIRAVDVALTALLLPLLVWVAVSYPGELVVVDDAGTYWLLGLVGPVVLVGLAVRVWLVVLLVRVAPAVEEVARPALLEPA